MIQKQVFANSAKLNIKRIKYFPHIVCFIFFLKFLFLSFYITPLWEVHDEIGHYSYARDIATNNSIPQASSAVIKKDILRQIYTDDMQPGKNWIAIHPPLYHVICAIFIKVSAYWELSDYANYRVPRIISSISGGLVIFIIYNTLLLVKRDEYLSLTFASMVGFTPMVSNLSSVTNHDIFLCALCSASIYFIVKYFVKERNGLQSLALAGIFLGLACVTKVTAVALGMILSVALLFLLSGKLVDCLHRLLLFTGTWMIPPFVWLLYKRFGVVESTTTQMGSLDNPELYSYSLDLMGIFEYTYLTNVLDQYLNNGLGLIGWMGKANSGLSLLPLGSWQLTIFQLLLCTLLFAFGSFILKGLVPLKDKVNLNVPTYSIPIAYKIENLTMILICFIAIFAICREIRCIECIDFLWSLIVSLIFITTFLCSCVVLKGLHYPVSRLAICWICIAAFAYVFLMRSFISYESTGRFIAIQGRYLFPIIPLLAICFYWTITRFKLKVAYIGASCVLLLVVLSEATFYLNEVIPVFQQ